MTRNPLTVHWNGGGQDTKAILRQLQGNPEYRARYVQGDLISIMSDTGDEYPETYEEVADMKAWCEENGVEFYHITADMGFHNQGWRSLEEHFARNKTIMGVGLRRNCTDNLKIQPCYKFLEQYLGQKYGYVTGKKRALYAYVREFGRLRCLYGFARGEESRCSSATAPELFPDLVPDKRPLWMQRNIQPVYPLIEQGADRKRAQEIIVAHGATVPPPSCCMMCPYQNTHNVLRLKRMYPEKWRRWVQHEQNKLDKCSDRPINLGVKGRVTLEEFAEKAERKYGHLTNEELTELRYKFGHGVASKY